MTAVKAMLLASAVLVSGGGAGFACGVTEGSVRILSSNYPAIRAINAAAAECAKDGVTVTANMTTEHRNIQGPALTAVPADYTTVVVTNSSLVPLLKDDLVRPLDDLVAAYGGAIGANQLITIDGQIMAIALMVNAQHLFYRSDILEAAGVGVPETYDEVLAAAEAIQSQGLMEYPLGGTYKSGWNVALEFVNMYLGYGGAFFEPGSAVPSIANAQGEAALEMMKALTSYMHPDFLTFDSNILEAEIESGNVAIANFWGSRAGGMTTGQGASAEVAESLRFAPAPSVVPGSAAASTLWWDGFAIASNVSDTDAQASFIAMSNGITAELANANADAAVWLTEGYEPAPAARSVLETAQSGTQPYPMEPYMNLMHAAVGTEIIAFLQGTETAAEALAGVEAAYIEAARQAGFIN